MKFTLIGAVIIVAILGFAIMIVVRKMRRAGGIKSSDLHKEPSTLRLRVEETNEN
jgi:hypothetical protein